MKKLLKVILIMAWVLLCIFLLDLVLKLILDAPLRTCKKACEQLEKSNAYILYYEDDVYKSEKSNISVNWKKVEEEFRVEQDKEANTITFYCYNGNDLSTFGRQRYSKHIFAFDIEGRLIVYCVLYYDNHQTEAYAKKTYKISYPG